MSLDPDLKVPRGVPAVRHRVAKVRDHVASECQDHLAVEEPLEIRLGGISLSVTMRTPGEDEELVAGFLFSEGIIAGADDLDVLARYRGPDGDPDEGNVMNVLLKGDARVAKERLRRNFVASSSCGLCGKATIDSIRASLPPVQSDLVISVDRLNRLGAAMHDAQATFEKTGGLGAVQHGGPDGARRRHDPHRVHAKRRVQSLRGRPSSGAERRGAGVKAMRNSRYEFWLR